MLTQPRQGKSLKEQMKGQFLLCCSREIGLALLGVQLYVHCVGPQPFPLPPVAAGQQLPAVVHDHPLSETPLQGPGQGGRDRRSRWSAGARSSNICTAVPFNARVSWAAALSMLQP